MQCPICKKEVALTDPHMPFCGERCQLIALGKTATLYTYPGENHVFAGWGWQLFMSRTLSYFNSYLNPRATPITVDKRVQAQERVASETNY